MHETVRGKWGSEGKKRTEKIKVEEKYHTKSKEKISVERRGYKRGKKTTRIIKRKKYLIKREERMGVEGIGDKERKGDWGKL